MSSGFQLIDDLLDAGRDILQEVNDAVDSRNYRGLGDAVSRRVDTATAKVQKDLKEHYASQDPYRNSPRPKPQPAQTPPAGAPYRNEGPRPAGQELPPKPDGRSPYVWQNGAAWRKAAQGSAPPSAYRYEKKAAVVPVPPAVPFLAKKVSRATGIWQIVLGTIGTVINGTILLAGLFSAATLEAGGFQAAGLAMVDIFFGLLTAGSIALLTYGIKKRGLMNRFYRYGDRVGKAEFLDIEAFARRIGVNARQLLADLKRMIRSGFLPNAKLDSGETTLMLTDKAYQQYLDAEQGRQEREEEERKREEELSRLSTEPEAVRLVEEGRRYLEKVREANKRIPETEMSEKLSRLEAIMQRIFDQVQKEPETAKDLRRFMDYYLPTVEKLLDGYIDLSEEGDTPTAARTRREIEDAMDVVNDAFEKILDSLFQDRAWDISSDISVMKTMFAQDGLMEDGLK